MGRGRAVGGRAPCDDAAGYREVTGGHFNLRPRKAGARQGYDSGNMLSDRLKVLIADDDANIRSVITTLVKRTLPSARVFALENGRLGLEYYERRGADLIISNFMMPEIRELMSQAVA